MVKKFLPLFALVLLLTGCASTTITNLTANRATRASNGYYMLEAQLDSRQQTLRWETLHPAVVLENGESIPMRHTSLMTNRWETLIPVPAGKNVVYYRFRFDYEYNAFGSAPKADSKLSQSYRLEILDK